MEVPRREIIRCSAGTLTIDGKEHEIIGDLELEYDVFSLEEHQGNFHLGSLRTEVKVHMPDAFLWVVEAMGGIHEWYRLIGAIP